MTMSAGGKGDGRGHGFRRDGPAEAQALRAVSSHQIRPPSLVNRDGDQRRPFLEDDLTRLIERSEDAHGREHERGADVGVSSERHLTGQA